MSASEEEQFLIEQKNDINVMVNKFYAQGKEIFIKIGLDRSDVESHFNEISLLFFRKYGNSKKKYLCKRLKQRGLNFLRKCDNYLKKTIIIDYNNKIDDVSAETPESCLMKKENNRG